MRGLFGSLAAPSRKAVPLDQLPGFLMNLESKTGISVTWSTALQVTAMFACCRVMGEDIAQARCRLLRPMAGGGNELAVDHPLYRLLFLEPEAGMTAFGLWETIVFHLMLVGNAFVFVNRVTSGRVFELILIEPGKVRVTRRADRTLVYEVAADDAGTYRTMPAGSIWHIRGPSWNGWMGMESVRLAREALGLSLALEASHAEMHRDGIKKSGAYSVEGELTGPQHTQLVTWLKRYAASGDLAGAPLILDRAAKWLDQQMSGVDAQHLETRRFQIEEVCRTARVMPIMIGLTDKTATYASVEQMQIMHGRCLAPLAGRIEQAAEVGLLTDAEKDQGLTVRFNLSAAMRADYKARQEGLQLQRRNGVINANEWRDLEDMNPRADPGGAQYVIEANMALQDGRDLIPVATPKPAA